VVEGKELFLILRFHNDRILLGGGHENTLPEVLVSALLSARFDPDDHFDSLLLGLLPLFILHYRELVKI
jgi:hypothetical protein